MSTMWISSNKVDVANQKDQCFHDLIEECKHAAPGARLSYIMRNRLEKFPADVRREIVNRSKVGCTPLFIACKRGQVEIVEYLLAVCGADIEQKGLYEVPDDRSVHCVTPLWCAAVSGRLSVIRCLVHYGADINAVSDSGSTPVRSACFMTHLGIVQFLVENGAEINKANYNGGTCLINSVQSVQLCRYLLKHGADVNARDIQNKTALHYAIQEHRLETTKLLIEYGADIHAESRHGDDALRTACLKGAVRIFEYLTQHVKYSEVRLANAHELMGSTFLDEHNDKAASLLHWRLAQKLRETHGLLPKMPIMPPRSAFHNQKEFSTMEELENIATDVDSIRIQSLLICERILGPYHKDMVFRLMFRGASYADSLRFQQCIDLWRRALEIRVEKDSILFPDTCFSAQALVRLMINMEANRENAIITVEDWNQRFNDVVATFHLLTDNIAEARQLLKIKPAHKRQMDNFDRILKCITHLIFLMVVTANTKEHKDLVVELITRLVRINPRSSATGDTLLHLCVSRLNTIRSSYFSEEFRIIFPKVNVIKLLLECGANVNARNETKSTPLHVASVPYNYVPDIFQILLDYGGHIDQPNSSGECPLLKIAQDPNHNIHLVNYVTLKCLCATVVSRYKIPYQNLIPKTLEEFVQLHEA